MERKLQTVFNPILAFLAAFCFLLMIQQTANGLTISLWMLSELSLCVNSQESEYLFSINTYESEYSKINESWNIYESKKSSLV